VKKKKRTRGGEVSLFPIFRCGVARCELKEKKIRDLTPTRREKRERKKRRGRLYLSKETGKKRVTGKLKVQTRESGKRERWGVQTHSSRTCSKTEGCDTKRA